MGDFRSHMRAAVSESRRTLMRSEKIASRGDLWTKKNVMTKEKETGFPKITDYFGIHPKQSV